MMKKTLNIKNILMDSFRNIYDVGVYLLLFELVYKGLILILFKPVLNVIVSLFIRAGGYEVLVNGDISRFLFSFSGVLMVLVVMVTSVVLVYYEFTVIILILEQSKKKQEIKLLELTQEALLKLQNVIQIKQMGLALYILILIPILNIGIQSALVPTLSIPDFIIGELAKYPGSEYLFIFLGLILLSLFAKLFIVLPVMILENKSFNEASKKSFRVIKGEGFQIAFTIFIGLALWLLLSDLPFMLLENVQFIVLRILRWFSNISMTLFTLLISPFILAISLSVYYDYIRIGQLSVGEIKENIPLGFVSKKVWSVLEIVFAFIQKVISKVREHVKVFLLVALVLTIIFNVYFEESISPIYDKQLLVGHRGGEYGVENTIDTILYAGLNGADYVEMDVLLSLDNIPVVIHDNNLKRLGGVSKNISDLTYEEISQIKIKGGGKESNIPSLTDLARAVKGKTKLLLEFKTHGKEQVSIVDKVMEILDDEGILEETIFHTSEEDIIKEFGEKHPDLTMGYVFIGTIGNLSSSKMAKMPIKFISAEESLISKNLLKAAHRADVAVYAWTINDDYKAKRLFELGVDAVITDYPVEMVPLRDEFIEFHENWDFLE